MPLNPLNQKYFLEYNHGCGDSFYKSKLPAVQINLHFGEFDLVKIVTTTSRYRDLIVIINAFPFKKNMSILNGEHYRLISGPTNCLTLVNIVLQYTDCKACNVLYHNGKYHDFAFFSNCHIIIF